MTQSDILDTLPSPVHEDLRLLKPAFDQLDSGFAVYEPDDRILCCNPCFREMYKDVADLLVPGASYADFSRAFYRRSFSRHTAMTEERFVNFRLAAYRDPAERDHELRVDEDRLILWSDKTTADSCVIGFRHDINARKKAELELEESEERFRSPLAMSSDWYWEQDKSYCFTRVSRGMAPATRVSLMQRAGKPRCEIPYLGISNEQMDEHRKMVEAHQPFRDFQHAYSLASGEICWGSISGEPMYDSPGVFREYRGLGTNITEKKRVETHIRERAEYDFLMGLTNRMLLGARFDFAVRELMRIAAGVALMFSDLGRFKNINDSLGHHISDQILAGTATRLREYMRATDTVSRHGGDEFIVPQPGVTEASALSQIVETLIKKIGEPQLVNKHNLTVTPSIGITQWPTDGEDLNTLIVNADLAMYHSKNGGRNQYSFFRAEMNARVSERLNIENALRRALALINVACEFSLVYQPTVHLPERWVIGVESLLRWRSADLGEVEPPRFVPVAEESGRIIKIGEWFVREACRQLARWRAVGLVHLPLTINVSGLQLKAKRMTDVLLAATQANELTPQDIEIELTESALVSEGDNVNGTLAAMAEAGFRPVVDDFGTGYSTLANLKRFDISKLKIDQIFVRDINIDPDVAAITHGIVGLARNLGLRVVAKGIEHVAQLDDLLASGCEEAQGFLLATPMDAQTFQQQASLNKC